MNVIESAISRLDSLRGMLLDRQAGKAVPQVLVDNELRLLTERVRAMIDALSEEHVGPERVTPAILAVAQSVESGTPKEYGEARAQWIEGHRCRSCGGNVKVGGHTQTCSVPDLLRVAAKADRLSVSPAPVAPGVGGLNFDIPEKQVGLRVMEIEDYDGNRKFTPGMQPAWWAAYDEALQRQHRALIDAAVSKAREEVRERWIESAGTEYPVGDFGAWLDTQLKENET